MLIETAPVINGQLGPQITTKRLICKNDYSNISLMITKMGIRLVITIQAPHITVNNYSRGWGPVSVVRVAT